MIATKSEVSFVDKVRMIQDHTDVLTQYLELWCVWWISPTHGGLYKIDANVFISSLGVATRPKFSEGATPHAYVIESCATSQKEYV